MWLSSSLTQLLERGGSAMRKREFLVDISGQVFSVKVPLVCDYCNTEISNYEGYVETGYAKVYRDKAGEEWIEACICEKCRRKLFKKFPVVEDKELAHSVASAIDRPPQVIGFTWR